MFYLGILKVKRRACCTGYSIWANPYGLMIKGESKELEKDVSYSE